MSYMNINKSKLWAAPVVSALFLILAFPRFNLGFLAWVAIIPFLWFCLNTNKRHAFWGGILFGFVFHFYLNSYLIPLLCDYAGIPLGLLAVFLMVCILSLFYGLFSFLASFLKQKLPPALIMFVIPSLWLLIEYLRSLGLLGYTAGYIGYSQWSYPVFLNVASVYGYWGIAFLMVMLQATIALMLSGLTSKNALIKTGVVWCILLVVGLTLPQAFQQKQQDTTYQIALVQPNNSLEILLDPAYSEEILNRYLELSNKAIEKYPDLDLIVWPETAISLKMGDGQATVEEIETLVDKNEMPLLYGVTRLKEGNRYNSIALLEPGREKPKSYLKNRLVPFVEYFPYPELLNQMIDIDLNMGTYSPGKKASPLSWNDTLLGGVICFESYFGDYTRQVVNKGADHLFILTNDAWFRDTIGKDQHAHVASIRAAETGTGVTQVANTGITISFDYQGRKTLEAPKKEEGVFLLETNFSSRPTVYRYGGEYFLYSTILISVVLGLTYRFKKKKQDS